MRTSKNKESILIITQDLKLNRTASYRYFSFIKALKNNYHSVKGIGVDFTFRPHPINSLEKNDDYLALSEDIITIIPTKLNFIQKTLTLLDKYNAPFSIKKIFLALHIVIYKTDQWVVNLIDFADLKRSKPTIIIAGGSSGIIKSSYLLAKKFNAKFIIDYRDPLNFGYHLLETNKTISEFKRFFTLKKELSFLNKADEIITVSASLKSFFPQQFHHKITIIENGSNFEEEDIVDSIIDCPPTFNIVYLGTIYNEQLFDISFFSSLHAFIKENKISPKQLKLFFLGSIQNKKLPSIIEKFNLTKFTTITPRLNMEQIKEYALHASLFLHLKFGERSKIITSKNADYLLFRKPILLPHTDEGDISESILKHKAGYVCDGTNSSIINVLNIEFKKHLEGKRATLQQPDLSNICRSKIAEKLIKII